MFSSTFRTSCVELSVLRKLLYFFYTLTKRALGNAERGLLVKVGKVIRMSMEIDRKKEVINICLDLFIEKGLTATSTRNLSSALKLQNAGLYYYFESKDEAVIACAEEAAIRLENALIPAALKDIGDPDIMMKRLQSRADEMSPTMRFLVSVCVSSQYKDKMKPALDRLAERYHHYAELVAKKLNCKMEDIEPYVYMVITAVANYMIFSEDALVYPQIQIAKDAIRNILSSSENSA